MKTDNIKKALPLAIVASIALSVFACTDRIEISTENAKEHLVIYGHITNKSERHGIEITRSAGYFTTDAPVRVTDADVSITSSAGVVLYMPENSPGVYETLFPVPGIEGETYTLDVELDFDGDGIREKYTASSYMNHAPELDSLALRWSPNFDDMVEVRIWGTLPEGEKNHYSIQLAINNQPINDSISKFYTVDDEYFNSRKIDSLEIYLLNQEEDYTILFEGDKVEIEVSTITKEFYDFVDYVQQEVNPSPPMFGGPPANVESNIRQTEGPVKIPIVGFFTAYAGNRVHTFSPQDFAK